MNPLLYFFWDFIEERKNNRFMKNSNIGTPYVHDEDAWFKSHKQV